MKITESQLRQLIDEEITLMVENGELDEGFLDRLRARAAGLGGRAKAKASELGAGAASALGARTAAGEMTAKAGERETAAGAQELAKIVNISAKKVKKANKYVQQQKAEIEKNLKGFNLSDQDRRTIEQSFKGAMDGLDALATSMEGLTAAALIPSADDDLELDDDE